MNKTELIKALAELFEQKMELGEEPTNGEVIQALFPNSKFTKMGYGNIEFAVDGFVFELTDRWLTKPYKADMRGE